MAETPIRKPSGPDQPSRLTAPPDPPPPPQAATPPPAPPPPRAASEPVEAEDLRLELQATRLQLQASQQELEAAQRHLAELEDLVRDLPQIFERKFQQRLQPLLDQQHLLAQDNQALRERARRALPAAPASPPAPAAEAASGTEQGAPRQGLQPLRALGDRLRRLSRRGGAPPTGGSADPTRR